MLICISFLDLLGARALTQEQAHDDVLVVVAEAAAEDVDAARMLGALVDADLEADRMVSREIEPRQQPAA